MQLTVITPAFTSKEKGKQGHGMVMFSTLLKIANVQKESILINDVKVSPFKMDGITFKQLEGALGSEFQFVGPGETVTLPPSMAEEVENTVEIKSKTGVDGPPFIIKTDEEKVMGIGIRFTYTPNIGEDNAARAMTKYISNKGLRISFQINGKYRGFTLRIQ
jgi:hypothetical protein